MREMLKSVIEVDTSSALALWLAFIGANIACLGGMALLLIW